MSITLGDSVINTKGRALMADRQRPLSLALCHQRVNAGSAMVDDISTRWAGWTGYDSGNGCCVPAIRGQATWLRNSNYYLRDPLAVGARLHSPLLSKLKFQRSARSARREDAERCGESVKKCKLNYFPSIYLPLTLKGLGTLHVQ